MTSIALAQDDLTGALRAIEVWLSEIREHNGGPIGSDQEFDEALQAAVAQHLRPIERSITPHQAICPGCRGQLDVHEYGIM